MISDFKISPEIIWNIFLIKEKLRFSLIFSFYCCLVKDGWTLKDAWQFAARGLVTYKPVAYKQK